MQTVECVRDHHDGTLSRHTAGPLPKSDSVQSLVSLMNCPTNPTASPTLDDSTVRGVDADANPHSVVVTPETDHIALSGLGLETVTLNALDFGLSLRIREVSLAANALEAVDIAPLASCPALVVLTLNSNRISSLDLRPLASCPKLERLWLHDNRLETVDLHPLGGCKSLRSLYLEDNSLHESTLDLSPLTGTQNLRSLRLGGNRLGGRIDLTPLFQCPALSQFNIDTSVTLVADGVSSQARVSSALRRIVLDIKFTGKPVGEPAHPRLRRPTPLVTPKGCTPPVRLRRRVSPPGSPPGGVTKRKSPQETQPATPPAASPIVKVLLVGFRRLARYAAEDSFASCGKVMIRASNHDVATRDPSLLLDSHLVLMYAPSEKTLRQVTVVVGRIPTVVIGTERYRSSADNRMLELLDRFNFYVDPLDPEDTKAVYEMGRAYASGESTAPSTSVGSVRAADPLSNADSSPVSEDDEGGNGVDLRAPIRKSFSESALASAVGGVNIELEDIEDDEDSMDQRNGQSTSSSQPSHIHRSRSADGITDAPAEQDLPKVPAMTWSEVTRKLAERRNRRVGRGWGSYLGSDLSMHGKNKLRAERAAVEVVFSDLGGYAATDTCASIARACGLPKCAGPLLFRAALGSSFDIESTTPEAGVPNPPMERKNRRISTESFMAYWDSRLKAFDGEERLSNVLEDSHVTKPNRGDFDAGHSEYGAPLLRKSRTVMGPSTSLANFDMVGYVNNLNSGANRSDSCLRFLRSGSFSNIPSDLCCPCDAGIEALITCFMEGRSSRFGSFALVKMSEAIAIGSALVMYGLRGMSKNRVGGRARPVCPKEVRDGKLNAALIAAEVGIFEGVASGLSMDQIRSVKGCFATEASRGSMGRNGGIGVDCTLKLEDVQRFCATRKTLLPGAVELAMAAHCRKGTRMTLAEFSVFLCVLNNIASNGAVDYFFTVVDVDQDERWTLPDLRQFHMEKERMWLRDGMAVSELADLWMNLIDMIRPADAGRGITKRELCRLGAKERKLVIQSLLFVDDDHSLLNIRRTMELNKQATTSVVVM